MQLSIIKRSISVQTTIHDITNNFDKDNIDIVLVAHVLTPRGYDNPKQLNCSITEHFTVQEFNEIYTGIVNAGFFIRLVFFNELDFIQDITSNRDDYNKSVVFNLCRNGLGPNKKTVVPALCDLLGVTYTSSGSGACALARNKLLFSSLLLANGHPCPISGKVYDDFANRLSPMTRVIQKPIYESASQGVENYNLYTVSELKTHPQQQNIMFQEYIDGFECEVPIFKINNKVISLPPVGILFAKNKQTGILSYTESMENEYGFYPLEQVLPVETCIKIGNTAKEVFTLLDLAVYGRIDFRINKETHRYFIIDISTTPYVTKHSSFNFAIQKAGYCYEDIFNIIVYAALER